ncbi:MAG: precorrin-6y C5,15-methyltransferase (decarboxylating) subunit CbiE [Cyanobacteria bacterium P01_D01_bin.105]
MSMPPIHIIGVGLAGASSLTSELLSIVQSATLLVGGRRHLSAFENFIEAGAIDALPLEDFTQVFEDVRSHIAIHSHPQPVILASGDPLFFGVGRLLLADFPAEQLIFHPHISSIQLAFSRMKRPWQNATLLSVHGRSEERLVKALKRGDETVAVLIDSVMTPSAIATLIVALDIPVRYRLWVCENLGDKQERLSDHWPEQLANQPIDFAPLSVVVLQRQTDEVLAGLQTSRSEASSATGLATSSAQPPPLLLDSFPLESLPLVGLPDSVFKGFRDRPTLMTKREIRLLILGEIAPLDGQILWDIGAGTGSVSIELSRLCPNATLYAIEKTAMGTALIRENAKKLAIAPIHAIQGKAPDVLHTLPMPERVFIGGSSGQLIPILEYLSGKTLAQKELLLDNLPANYPVSQFPERIVLAIATLEHLTEVLNWLKSETPSMLWTYRLTQVNISRSLPVGPLTRFSPLTPIMLVTLFLKQSHEAISPVSA